MATDYTPKFTDPEQVVGICEEMQTFEDARAKDRELIDNLANGDPPFTPAEVKKHHVQFNVNWGEHGRLVDDANRQRDAALIHKDPLFTLRCVSQKARPEKRDGYTVSATTHINDALKRGEWSEYQMFMLHSRDASTTLHGIGPIEWSNPNSPKARFVPLENLLIPTDTGIDHENLMWKATNFSLTQGELLQMTDGDDGWNKKFVRQILRDLQDTKTKYQDTDDPVSEPEKWAERRKQNAGLFGGSSDAIPKVRLRSFHYRNPKTNQWYRKVLLRDDIGAGKVAAKDSFVYDAGEKVFAEKLSHFLHIQYGDINRVPPLMHHSVRGLGMMAYAPCEAMNRIRCQTAQHVFQNLQTWFKVRDPADRDRLKAFIMHQFTVMPEELQIVPQDQRHQIDVRQVEFIQAQMRQLMNESASSFVQDIDTGTKKEMTLGEAQIRLQQTSVMTGSSLRYGFAQEVFLYTEYVRRFMAKGSLDATVQEFQKACKRDGIPDELMVPSAWKVEIEQVLGDGDSTLAQQQANLLYSRRNDFDPQAARLLQRKWVVVTTKDPALAKVLVPDSKDESSSGTVAAENLFGTLMTGTQVEPREGIAQTDYCERMLMLLGQIVMRVSQADNTGTRPEVTGMMTVLNDINAHIEIIARDESQKELIKKLSDAMGELGNLVKAFDQRLTEKEQEAQNQPDPETLQKIESQKALTELKMQTSSVSAAQKLEQKEQAFSQKMQQAQAKQIADMVATQLEQKTAEMQAAQEIRIKEMQAAQDIRLKEMEARMNMAIKAAQAEAQAKIAAKTAADKPAPKKSGQGS